MKYKKLFAWMLLLCNIAPFEVFAEGAPKVAETSYPLAQLLLVIIIALAVCIIILAQVVIGSAQIAMQKHQEKKEGHTKTIVTHLLLVFFICGSNQVFAAETTALSVQIVDNFGGLQAGSFYGLVSVVLIELFILLVLLYNLHFLLRKEKSNQPIKEATTAAIATTHTWQKIWNKLNQFKPIKEEASIDLGHDYDGIRELDNRLPPWWLYGFYICVFFAMVYLWRYHVAHSAPSSIEELHIAQQKGEEEKAAYLKNAANNVDENSVQLMNTSDALDAGKQLFANNCAACHKADGGGQVGPNLTDDYWLHGGSLQDVFKSIKYGWQDKGMKSWKDDLSPIQIAQIASFIKSLHGTKPAIAKEPQGDLYTEMLAQPKADTAAKK